MQASADTRLMFIVFISRLIQIVPLIGLQTNTWQVESSIIFFLVFCPKQFTEQTLHSLSPKAILEVFSGVGSSRPKRATGFPFWIVYPAGLVFPEVMTDHDVLEVFRKTGALLEGHFVLRSGLHSRQYFQCALALQEMPDVERLGAEMAVKIGSFAPRTVIAPAMGGLVIGQEVARQLRCRFVFAEKVDGRLALRRGFRISSGEPILVVEDVITKGGRVQETIDIVRSLGGKVLAVATLVDRSDGTVDLGVPLVSLLRLSVETFDPANLPPDLAAIPVVKPGS